MALGVQPGTGTLLTCGNAHPRYGSGHDVIWTPLRGGSVMHCGTDVDMYTQPPATNAGSRIRNRSAPSLSVLPLILRSARISRPSTLTRA